VHADAWKTRGLKPLASKFGVWSPPSSPLLIEYSRELLRSLARGENDPDASGLLYGMRIRGGVRVLSQHPQKGLRVIGAFSARARGEVFMTESDVERLDGLDRKAVALVLAGDHAGFFVRASDGSMQTIQSYEEFAIRPPRVAARDMSWLPLAVASVISIALLAWPTSPFTIHDQNGALRIQLHSRSAGLLEIVDGPTHRAISLSPSLTSIVYVPQTSDVHVRLIR